MALNSTTLASACAIADKSILVASATGFTAGNFVLIDLEVCRVSKEYVSGTTIPLDGRGLEGTPQTAHPSGAKVVVGLPTDFADPGPGGLGGNTYASQPVRDRLSYSAAGAITLPSGGRDMVAIINGTGALAMTLAAPGVDLDTSVLYVIGNGKAAHTVTVTNGIGAGGAAVDVATFAAGGNQCLAFMAINGVWCIIPSFLAGTLTNITVTMS